MRKVIVSITVLALFLGLCACAADQPEHQGAGASHAPTWQEQYDLGVRYLSEGNYEEAIIAFTAAIEIDSKRAPAYVGRGDAYVKFGETQENLTAARADYEKAIELDKAIAEAYLSLADVYIKQGDTEAAIAILKNGLTVTGNMELQNALDKASGVIVPAELLQGTEMWTALEDFLKQFMWYKEYDCETAAVPTAINEWSQLSRNALEKMLSVPTCYNDALYPGEEWETVWFEPGTDPLGKFESYMKVNADKLHWILEHIFNCIPQDIETMKAPILSGQNENIYYWDGHYYFGIGGVGGPGFDISITSIELIGMRYYVEYNFNGLAYDEPEFRCAMVSLKEINGRTYWSLYYDREIYKGELQDTTGDSAEPRSGNTVADFIIENNVLVEYIGDSNIVVIPETVTSIGDRAFSDCKNITSVTIPHGVTSIGFSAFSNCTSLTKLTIPNSVTSIGGAAFFGCGLTDIVIPDSISVISSEMFSGCVNLSSITIPVSVTLVDRRAFELCYNLSDVYYGGSEAEWRQVRVDGYMDLNSDLLNAAVHCNKTR